MEGEHMIPTLEQLLDLFADYNARIWPMQIAAYLLGIAGFGLAFRKGNLSNRLIPVILPFFWLWVAFMFWLPNAQQGFAPGYLFAGIFLIQGLLFLIQAFRPKLSFGFQANPAAWAGIFFALYALVGYPLFGILIGHAYPHAPPFGLTPCPLIAFTFGLLLLTVQKVPKTLLIIPFFYALSGILWVLIGVLEDIGMVLSGLLGVGLIWARDAKATAVHPSEASSVSTDAGWSLDLADKK
jgi:hypothetical protein